MSTNVSFYLKDPKSDTSTNIILFKRVHYKPLKIYLSESIHPKDWDKKKQRAKLNSSDGYNTNAYLKHVELIASNGISEFLRNVRPENIDMRILKSRIEKLIDDNPLNPEQSIEVKNNIHEVMNEYFQFKAKKDKNGDIKKRDSYNSKLRRLQEHLYGIEKHIGGNLTFDNFRDYRFYDTILEYLYIKAEYSTNTAGRFFGFLKTFIKFAMANGIEPINLEYYKSFKEEADLIFFEEEQLVILEKYTYPDELYRRAEKLDMLLLLCHTGLRFSDLLDLDPFSCKEDYIIKSFIKTKSKNNVIPLSNVAKRILKKYKSRFAETGVFFPKISNQKFNEAIKLICKDVGFTHTIVKIRYYGDERREFRRPFYQEVSSHIGRRTFVVKSLRNGMSVPDVMDITDHYDMDSMKPYMKVSQTGLVKSFQEAWD